MQFHSLSYPFVSIGAPGERARDTGCGSSALLAKKAKTGFGAAAGAGRTGVSKQGGGDMVNLLSEEWENVAKEVSVNWKFTSKLCTR